MRTSFIPLSIFLPLLSVTCLSTQHYPAGNDANVGLASYIRFSFLFGIRMVKRDSGRWWQHRVQSSHGETIIIAFLMDCCATHPFCSVHGHRHWCRPHRERFLFCQNVCRFEIKNKKCFGFVWLIWIMLLLFCSLYFFFILFYCSLVAVCTQFIVYFFLQPKMLHFFIDLVWMENIFFLSTIKIRVGQLLHKRKCEIISEI